MFVGEGPGFHEDKQGEPFVGAAGKLLTELLGKIGLTRADVYIANVVKCRPPENRDPLPDEIEACSPHLMEQIAIIRPRVICTLGRFATKLLAETELSMTAIHGKAKEQEIGGVDLVVFPVFHPAAALYTPGEPPGAGGGLRQAAAPPGPWPERPGRGDRRAMPAAAPRRRPTQAAPPARSAAPDGGARPRRARPHSPPPSGAVASVVDEGHVVLRRQGVGSGRAEADRTQAGRGRCGPATSSFSTGRSAPARPRSSARSPKPWR